MPKCLSDQRCLDFSIPPPYQTLALLPMRSSITALAQVSVASTPILRPILSDSYSTIPLSSKLRGLSHQGKHGSPPEHTVPQLTCCSHPQQVAYGVYMGKETEADGDEDQITGYSPPMCPQTKERAEVMAVNSAVRRALIAIENCVELPPGNQISVCTMVVSSDACYAFLYSFHEFGPRISPWYMTC
jgi:hypothetical protein